MGNIFFFSIQQTLIISLNHIHRDQAHQPIDLIIQLNLTGDLKKLFSVKSEHNFIAVASRVDHHFVGFFCFGEWFWLSVVALVTNSSVVNFFPHFTVVLYWAASRQIMCLSRQMPARQARFALGYPTTCSAWSLFQDCLCVFCCPIGGGWDRLHPGKPNQWLEGRAHCQSLDDPLFPYT